MFSQTQASSTAAAKVSHLTVGWGAPPSTNANTGRGCSFMALSAFWLLFWPSCVSVSVKKSAKTDSLAEKKLVSAGATVELASLAPAPLQLRPQAKFAPLFSSPLS